MPLRPKFWLESPNQWKNGRRPLLERIVGRSFARSRLGDSMELKSVHPEGCSGGAPLIRCHRASLSKSILRRGRPSKNQC